MRRYQMAYFLYLRSTILCQSNFSNQICIGILKHPKYSDFGISVIILGDEETVGMSMRRLKWFSDWIPCASNKAFPLATGSETLRIRCPIHPVSYPNFIQSPWGIGKKFEIRRLCAERVGSKPRNNTSLQLFKNAVEGRVGDKYSRVWKLEVIEFFQRESRGMFKGLDKR